MCDTVDIGLLPDALLSVPVHSLATSDILLTISRDLAKSFYKELDLMQDLDHMRFARLTVILGRSIDSGNSFPWGNPPKPPSYTSMEVVQGLQKPVEVIYNVNFDHRGLINTNSWNFQVFTWQKTSRP